MISKATRRFWKRYSELPEPVQRLAVKNYHLWRDNPRHPSLDLRNSAVAANASPSVSAIIIARWVTKSETALSGYGSARTRNTTSSLDEGCSLGLALPDDHAHSPNEKFDLDVFAKGQRMRAFLWQELTRS